jgi:hypothetical protein
MDQRFFQQAAKTPVSADNILPLLNRGVPW